MLTIIIFFPFNSPSLNKTILTNNNTYVKSTLAMPLTCKNYIKLLTKRHFKCPVSQMISVLNQTAVSVGLGLIAGVVVLTHSTVMVAVADWVALGLVQVDILVEVLIVGAVVAEVHKPVALEGPVVKGPLVAKEAPAALGVLAAL